MPVNPGAGFAAAVLPLGDQPVRAGQLFSFQISTGLAGFGHLYLLTNTGEVIALGENLQLGGGVRFRYPPDGAASVLRAKPPAGVDRVVLVVTRQPFAGLVGRNGRRFHDPVAILETHQDFLDRMRRTLSALPPSDWAVAESLVEVVGN